jgi:predicted nucleic acid-binding protein
MANEVMLDASVLIEYFRARKKENTILAQVARKHENRSISVVAKMEVLYGVPAEMIEYWNTVFAEIESVPFTDEMVAKSHEIILDLKRKNCLIEMEDVMIAATAIVQNLHLATLNRKHFERIEGLKLFDDERNQL